MSNNRLGFLIASVLMVCVFEGVQSLKSRRAPGPPPVPVPTAVEPETQPGPALEVLNSKPPKNPTKCAIDEIGTSRNFTFKNWVFRCTGKEKFAKGTAKMGGYTFSELREIAEKAGRIKHRSVQELISENNRPMPRGTIEVIGGPRPLPPMVPCTSSKADRSALFRPDLRGPWLCAEKGLIRRLGKPGEVEIP